MQSNSKVDYKKSLWISKQLSWILRHGALIEKLAISSEGFVSVEEILNCPKFSNCTLEDIERVVLTNNKQRFTLRKSREGKLEIRANQGHSISEISNLELTPITNPSSFANVIHGTYFKFWNSIKKEGLFRGRRNHIHFAHGLPHDKSVISGLRGSAEIFIYVDLRKALVAGLQFFLSSNDVILSPGNETGHILPEYFLKVCCAVDNSQLML